MVCASDHVVLPHSGVQLSWLHNNGKELLLVSSGAVAFGRQRLKQEELLSRTMRSTLQLRAGGSPSPAPPKSRACAAVGQAGLMALYESMFAQYGVSCAQVNCDRGGGIGCV